MDKITISGIEILVNKKKIKHMHLAVLPPDGIVRVSVPITVDDDTIRLFVISKISWIKKQTEKYKNQARQSKREYIDGESVYVWGQRYRLMVKHSGKRNKVIIKGDRLYLYVRKKSTVEQRENALNKWYRGLLKGEVPKLIKIWQKKMDVTTESWGIKNMKTRWGSCNVDKQRIWINLQLAKKPLNCLEYVVVHELTHLLEKSHNEVFVGYMDKFLPDWRMRKDELNNYILDYMDSKETYHE